MKWLLNNSARIIKNKYPQTDSMPIDDSTYINFNQSQSHVYIRNDSHQINQCEYKVKSVNYDVRHAYGINWKLNNGYHFHS